MVCVGTVFRNGARGDACPPDAPSSRRETLVGDGEGLRAGEADDGEAAFAERRCDGGDGVVEHLDVPAISGGVFGVAAREEEGAFS